MIAGHMTDNQFRAAYIDAVADGVIDYDDIADYMHDNLSPVFDPDHERTMVEYFDFRELCVEYVIRYIHIDALNGPGTVRSDAANGRDSA